jgi:hypothetical protein
MTSPVGMSSATETAERRDNETNKQKKGRIDKRQLLEF